MKTKEIKEMINTFWQEFCQAKLLDLPQPEAWMFGDGTKEMGDELGQLVLDEKKSATCSAYELYDIRKDQLPQIGQYDIILDGDNQPIAITRVKQITLSKMTDVTPKFSKKEGEGDLSHDYWFKGHEDFFTKEYASLGLVFSTDKELVCEEFEVVFLKK